MSSSRSRTGVATVSGLALVAAVGFLWYESRGPGYYSELNAIREEIRKIPKVEILELSGIDDDGFPFLSRLDHITVRLRIAGKGELVVGELSRSSVDDAKHLYLVSVGPYRVRVRGEGFVGVYKHATGEPMRTEFAGGPVDIGPEGDFARFFPFKIPNIQSAVAHYDDILEIVGGWPETPSAPRHFKNAQGTDYYYWVGTQGRDEGDPLWKQPFSRLRANASSRK